MIPQSAVSAHKFMTEQPRWAGEEDYATLVNNEVPLPACAPCAQIFPGMFVPVMCNVWYDAVSHNPHRSQCFGEGSNTENVRVAIKNMGICAVRLVPDNKKVKLAFEFFASNGFCELPITGKVASKQQFDDIKEALDHAIGHCPHMLDNLIESADVLKILLGDDSGNFFVQYIFGKTMAEGVDTLCKFLMMVDDGQDKLVQGALARGVGRVIECLTDRSDFGELLESCPHVTALVKHIGIHAHVWVMSKRANFALNGNQHADRRGNGLLEKAPMWFIDLVAESIQAVDEEKRNQTSFQVCSQKLQSRETAEASMRIAHFHLADGTAWKLPSLEAAPREMNCRGTSWRRSRSTGCL